MRASPFARFTLVGAIGLLLAAALASCGGGGDDNGAGDQPDFQVTLTMRGTNGAETSTFVFGKPIVFDLTVVNRSGGTQVLTLPTSQIYDLAVFPEGSQTPRFRWSLNRTFTPAATNLSFTRNGSQVILNWPAGQGWKLQAQTNALNLGLRTNWVEVTGATPPYTNTVSPANRPTRSRSVSSSRAVW